MQIFFVKNTRTGENGPICGLAQEMTKFMVSVCLAQTSCAPPTVNTTTAGDSNDESLCFTGVGGVFVWCL